MMNTPEDSRSGDAVGRSYAGEKSSGVFVYNGGVKMEKNSITKEEAGKVCVEIANGIRNGVLNEIQVLYDRLFNEAPGENELEPIWIMAGSNLEHIIQHAKDFLDDIEGGRFIPQKVEA